MKSHLKVKVYSLSHEMRYIRRLENKWKRRAKFARQKKNDVSQSYSENNFWTLREHRDDMKLDARVAHLTYGFMRGVPYSKMEQLCYGIYKGYGSSEPRWDFIEAMMVRFSKDEPNQQDIAQRFAEWIEAAKAWYETNKERIPLVLAMRKAGRAAMLNDPVRQAERKKHNEQAEKHGRMVHNASYT